MPLLDLAAAQKVCHVRMISGKGSSQKQNIYFSIFFPPPFPYAIAHEDWQTSYSLLKSASL